MPRIPRSPILAGVFLHQEQLIWISEASQELDETERKLARPLDGLRRDSPPKLPTMRRNSKTSTNKGSFIVRHEEDIDVTKLPGKNKLVIQPSLPSPSSSSIHSLSPTSPSHPLRHTRLNSVTSASSSTRSAGSSYTSSIGRNSISTSSTSDGVPVINLGHIAEDADLDELSCQLDQLARRRSSASSSSTGNSASPRSLTSSRAIDWDSTKLQDSKRISNQKATPTYDKAAETSPASLSTTPRTVYNVSLGHISPDTDLDRLAEELDDLAIHTLENQPATLVSSENTPDFGNLDGRESSPESSGGSPQQIDKRRKRDVPLMFTSEPHREFRPLAYTRSSVSSGEQLFEPAPPAAPPSHPQLKPSPAKKIPRKPIPRSSPLYKIGSRESDDSPVAILVDTNDGKQKKHITLAEALRDAELDDDLDSDHVADTAMSLSAAGKQETHSSLRIRFPEKLIKAQSSERRRTQSAPTSPGADVLIISDWLDGWRLKYDPMEAVKQEIVSFERYSPQSAGQPALNTASKATYGESAVTKDADWYTFPSSIRASPTSAIPISKQAGRLPPFPEAEQSFSRQPAKAGKYQAATIQTGTREDMKENEASFMADIQRRRRAQTGLNLNSVQSPRSPSLRVRFVDAA